MTMRSWIRKLFAAPKCQTIRKAPRRGRSLGVETLEDRITPADLVYSAIDHTPLTLLLNGANLQVVNTAIPSQVFASKALSAITTGVFIDGSGFNVNLTIDASVPAVGGDVQFVGGSGTNALRGPNASTEWVVSGIGAGTASAESGAVVEFQGVENLGGGNADDIFLVIAGSSVAGIIDGGAGSGADALLGPNMSNVWVVGGPGQGTLNGRSFAGMETLIGERGNDFFRIAAGGSVDAIHGGNDDDGGAGAATDTLDYSPQSGPVDVNLASAAATGVGEFSAIDSIVGGSGIDTLHGPEDAQVAWSITGANAGTVQGTRFAGFENLAGAALVASDAFRFEAGGSVSGTVGGGAGTADTFAVYQSPGTYTAFNPAAVDEAGTATVNGQTVLYSGMDHFNPLDSGDPNNVHIRGTIFGETIVLEAGTTPGYTRVRFE